MLRKRAAAALLACTLASIHVVPAAMATASPETTTGASEVREFLNELTVRVARDRVPPTKSSRLYANVAYAMFLASANANDALLARLQKTPSLSPRQANIDPVVAALAAGGSVARSLFLVPAARITFGEARDRLLREASQGLASSVVNESISYGVSVADAVAARAGADGFEESKKVVAPDTTEPGMWVPTQPNFQPAIDPGWGTLTTFFATSKDCSLPPPPTQGTIDSPYKIAADEVATVTKNLTEEQKSIARFWDDSRGRTGTPSGHWLALALAATDGKKSSALETIQVVAHMLMVVADSFVVNFGEKYKYMVERPITVLQRTDPSWSSYLPTPAFPEYPSGHSTISTAAADVLTAYFGEWAFSDPGYGMTEESRKKFEVTARNFSSFAEAADEASISRLYGGIHFTFGLEGGATLGTCIAKNSLGG
jgi:hypothetical protein